MLSRTLLRSLPRASSRFASYSTRIAFQPATQSSLRYNVASLQRLQPLKVAFSTSAARRDDIGQELGAKLDSEIAIESENETTQHDSDNNIKLFIEQNDFWTINDTEGDQEIVLKRSYDDETITVSFSIADFNSASMMPDEEADEALMDDDQDLDGTGQSGGANTKGAVNQGRTSAGNMKVAPEDSIAPGDREELRNDEDDYSDESQSAFPANVNVLIQRSNRGALRVHLVADSGRFTIHGVTHLPESSASATEQLHNPPESLYTGPPFQQLDEEVQGLLEQYLDVRGINAALAQFIPDYIDVKEQKEYLGWLGRVKQFVE